LKLNFLPFFAGATAFFGATFFFDLERYSSSSSSSSEAKNIKSK
jgi:hypothetical protein